MTPRFFRSPAAFRAWLEKRHTVTRELWVGFYTNGAANPDKTFSMQLTLPRLGSTYRAALENTPGPATQWGSLDFDPSVVQKIASRPPDGFVYPRSLDGRAKCGR